MSQEREKIIECTLLTLVGLLALAAILVFLPEASAQCADHPVKAAGTFATTAPALSAERTIPSGQDENT